MTTITTRRIAVLLAALVTLSVLGPMAALGAPSVDNETTEDPETSEVTNNAVYSNFNASGDIGWLNASYDSDNKALEIIDPATDEVINRIGNGSTRWNEYNTSANKYGINLSESDFATMPMDANENKTVTLRMIGNTSADNPPTTNITIYLENTDERAVVHAGSTATDDGGIAEVEETEKGALWWASTENITTVEADAVGVNGSATDVIVVYEDDTVAEPYENAAANKSAWFGLSTADYENGDLIGDHVGFVEDSAYGIYYEEVPDAAENPEDHTYMTYTTVNGEPVHVVNLGDEYEDETSVDVETIGNDTPEIGTDVQELDTGGFLGLTVTAMPSLVTPAGA